MQIYTKIVRWRSIRIQLTLPNQSLIYDSHENPSSTTFFSRVLPRTRIPATTYQIFSHRLMGSLKIIIGRQPQKRSINLYNNYILPHFDTWIVL